MKILQLCNKPPLPAIDGGCIAMKNISFGLLDQNVDLTIITISTVKHPFNKKYYPTDFLNKTKIKGVYIDTKINVVDAFSAIITSDNYNVSRFFSADFDILLKKTLQENNYDFIHLESLFLTPYIDTIKKYSKAKIVLRSHNLEYLIWERLAIFEQNKPKQLYLKHLAKNLKKYEISTLNNVDGIAAISYMDTIRYNNLKCKIPITTIPFGININEYIPKYNTPQKKLSLFHIGSMDWMPNIEAVNWFIDNVFPLLDKSKIEIHLAGKNMPLKIKNKKIEGLFNHGKVNSAIDFISKHDIMIVPLKSGGGMRIKIIEGMALGKTIITTSVGLEGIDATHEKNIIIANTPNDFKEAIETLLQNPDKIKSIGINARKFIEKNHNNTLLSKQLINFYNSL